MDTQLEEERNKDKTQNGTKGPYEKKKKMVWGGDQKSITKAHCMINMIDKYKKEVNSIRRAHAKPNFGKRATTVVKRTANHEGANDMAIKKSYGS